jgi:signal transduction histidine kinase
MKTYRQSTVKKTIHLIVLTHLVFLILIVLMYFRVMYQESSLLSHLQLLSTDTTALASEFSMSFSSTKNSLLLFAVLIILSLFSYIVFVKKNLFHPIQLITSALETGSKKCIKLLKAIPGEFHHIGNLFQDSDNYKFELVTAKTKAEESERLKTTFLENLSHEIRTPMNAILGFTDLLMTTEISKEDENKYLSIIHKSGSNLVSIIEDLIELSKIDTNQVTANYSDIDLEKCLHELHTTLQVNLDTAQTIHFYVKESSTRLFYNVKVDEVKLKQVLTNLINNALKYTEKGYVYFGYEIIEESELSFIEFTVKDTGIGVSKEYQKVIFDRFKRVESDLAIEKGGLGLGLAISKAYVEMMGGTISIQSSAGEGTSVTFRIPLKFDKTEKKPSVCTTNLNSKPCAGLKAILVAEDDSINFLLIKKMLQVTEYEILRAENGQVAVDLALKNQHISLVLMDIKMPVMNGYEAFEKIKAVLPDMPIIAQTAHASETDRDKIMTMGFTDYITKPLDKELLLDLVRAQLTE